MNEQTLTPEKIATMKENIRQADAIMRFEGCEPTEQDRAIDAAVLAGRVTRAQVSDELVAYAREHKSIDGFIASRPWA